MAAILLHFQETFAFESLNPTGIGLVNTGLSLACGSGGKFQLQRVKRGQRPLRHFTPLNW